ncbi:MAG: hypothetical protein EPO16_09085 [Dehalococcoidia bacterium]|nr:MAG: hypothetical protein EPO16_09085 [Dehalococcoidia bacterium]
MKCTECGRPLHPARPVCDFCGAPAPSSRVDALRWLAGQAREAAAGASTRARSIRGREFSVHVPRRFLVALGAGATAVLVVALLLSLDRGQPEKAADASPTPDAAVLQASIDEARTKEAALLTAIDAAGQQISDLQTAQERARTAAEASTATAAAEIARLQGQVKTAEGNAKTAQEAADRAARRVQVLTECLNGTAVALQFARSDSWGPADRALAAVASACAEARSLR